MPTQSKGELTIDKQILYLVQWFAEFSDFQRGDFLADHLIPLFGPFLKEKILKKDGLMNGDVEKVVNGVGELDLTDPARPPPSIFQCRMKLFAEWFATWSETDRLEFLLRLRNIDSGFLSEFYRLFLHQNGVNSNEELQEQVNPDEDGLLQRLDINEKVFESKLPEILARYDPAPRSFSAMNGHTPDLLNEVVGIQCDSGSSSIEEQNPVEEVVPVVAKVVEVEVDAVPETEDSTEEPKAAEPVTESTESAEPVPVECEDLVEIQPAEVIQEVTPIVTVTISPPDVVA